MNAKYAPAAVNPSQLEEIQKLESQLGKVLVAVEPSQKFAYLNPDELSTIRKAEQKLGLVMVAYED